MIKEIVIKELIIGGDDYIGGETNEKSIITRDIKSL